MVLLHQGHADTHDDGAGDLLVAVFMLMMRPPSMTDTTRVTRRRAMPGSHSTSAKLRAEGVGGEVAGIGRDAGDAALDGDGVGLGEFEDLLEGNAAGWRFNRLHAHGGGEGEAGGVLPPVNGVPEVWVARVSSALTAASAPSATGGDDGGGGAGAAGAGARNESTVADDDVDLFDRDAVCGR